MVGRALLVLAWLVAISSTQGVNQTHHAAVLAAAAGQGHNITQAGNHTQHDLLTAAAAGAATANMGGGDSSGSEADAAALLAAATSGAANLTEAQLEAIGMGDQASGAASDQTGTEEEQQLDAAAHLPPVSQFERPVPYAGGSCFRGEWSFLGEYCPNGPNNRGIHRNVCPAGFSCPPTSVFLPGERVPTQRRPQRLNCPRGRFCPQATWNGGIECPQTLTAQTMLAWGYAAFCGERSSAPGVCPAGYMCPNASARFRCPIGHWCGVGMNASLECSSDLFGLRSAEERCPAGSTAPPSRREMLIWLLIGLVLLFVLAECASILERRRRRRRHGKGLQLSNKAQEVVKELPDSAHLAHAQQPADMDATAWKVAWLALVRGTDVHHPDHHHHHHHHQRRSRRPSGAACVKAPSSGSSPKSFTPTGIFAFFSPRKSPQTSPAPAKPPPASMQRSESRLSSEGSAPTIGRGSFAESVALLEDVDIVGKGSTFTHVEMRDLSFHIGQAHVLHSLSSNLHHGELVGLMGESGSGKSTLLNILGGRATYGQMSGDLLINGHHFDPHASRHLLGYVPQAHIVFKELTVYENLAYAAELRLRRPNTREMRDHLVEMALDLLGLNECRHFVCDPSIGERLSGGQMRRIGIGMELVCNPPIMLLDEPTSALDAVNTRLVVSALQDLANRGILVIASLHQPRHAVYEMLDRLLLLRKGELIFGGLRADSLDYFRHLGFHLPHHANPADFFIEVAFGFEASDKVLADVMSLDGSKQPSDATETGNSLTGDATFMQLKKRLPGTPARRLQIALDLTNQHSGRAFALLLTPCDTLKQAEMLWTRPHCRRTYEDLQELGHTLPNRTEWWSSEMVREAQTRTVSSVDLGRMWRQWFISSMSHAERIMAFLADRQSAGRLHAHALLRFVKNVAKRMAERSAKKEAFLNQTSDPPLHRHSIGAAAFSMSELKSRAYLTQSAPELHTTASILDSAASASEDPDESAHIIARLGVRTESFEASDTSSGTASYASRAWRLSAVCNARLDDSTRHSGTAPSAKQRLNVGVTEDEFMEWFEEEYQAGEVLQPELARMVWARAAAKVQHHSPGLSWVTRRLGRERKDLFAPSEHGEDGLLPTWTCLRYEMYCWQLPEGATAGWLSTFSVCARRYLKKHLRTRRRTYMLLIVTIILGLLCGTLHGDSPSTNDIMIFMLLFNSLFGTLVSTSTIPSLGGASTEDCAFFQHEAASGVQQTAEVVSRLLIDLAWPLWLLAIAFALPIKGLSYLPLSGMDIILDWWLMTFAFSPLGYVFALLTPGNAVVLTSSAALVSCAFGTGFFGLRISDLPERMRPIFPWLSPGMPALWLISFGNTIKRPLSQPRATVLTHLFRAGLIERPSDDEPLEDLRIERSGELWEYDSILQLFTFGCVLRILAIVLFTCRSNNSWARWKGALRDVLRRRPRMPRITTVRPPPALHTVASNREVLDIYNHEPRAFVAATERASIRETMNARRSVLVGRAQTVPAQAEEEEDAVLSHSAPAAVMRPIQRLSQSQRLAASADAFVSSRVARARAANIAKRSHVPGMLSDCLSTPAGDEAAALTAEEPGAIAFKRSSIAARAGSMRRSLTRPSERRWSELRDEPGLEITGSAADDAEMVALPVQGALEQWNSNDEMRSV